VYTYIYIYTEGERSIMCNVICMILHQRAGSHCFWFLYNRAKWLFVYLGTSTQLISSAVERHKSLVQLHCGYLATVAGQRVWRSNERHLHNRGNVPYEDYLSGTLEKESYKKWAWELRHLSRSAESMLNKCDIRKFYSRVE